MGRKGDKAGERESERRGAAGRGGRPEVGRKGQGGGRGREKQRSCQEFSVTLKSVFVPSDSHGRGGARLQECKSRMHRAYDTTDGHSILPLPLSLLSLPLPRRDAFQRTGSSGVDARAAFNIVSIHESFAGQTD